MALSTETLQRGIRTLESALKGLSDYQAGEVAYEIYRAACVKQFELVLEQSGRLLRKEISARPASNRAAVLTFTDVFRTAAEQGLIEAEACERWLGYRDSRHAAAHDYSEEFAESAVRQLPQFVLDAKALARNLGKSGDG